MAHFYGDLRGSRGEATRIGSEGSGIRAHVRGWGFGIKVYGAVDADGCDCFEVFLTYGSNGAGCDRLIGRFTRADLEKELQP